MAHKKSGDDLRGLIIPDTRISFLGSFSEADTVATQASPRPGVPEPLVDSDMYLQTSGSQSSDMDMRIYGHVPGHVDDESARFHWKHTTGTDTTVKGWNPPNTGFRGVEHLHEDQSLHRKHRIDVITLTDGSLVACSPVDDSSGYTADPQIWYRRSEDSYWRSGSGGAGDPFGVGIVRNWLDQTTDSNVRGSGGALVELPSGRVLHFFWATQTEFIDDPAWSGSESRNDVYNIRCNKSDDRGVTWSVHSMECLKDSVGKSTTAGSLAAYVPGQLKAAYKDGQILLISSVVITSQHPNATYGLEWTGSDRYAGNTWLQMASSDLGATFDRVEAGSGEAGQNGTGFCVAVVNGEFVISYIRNALTLAGGGTDDYPISDIAVAKIGSAYQRLSNATVYSFKNAHITYAVTGDDDGSIPNGGVPAWPGHNGDPRIFDWEMALCASPEGDLYMGVCGFGYKIDQVGNVTGSSENQWNISRFFISSDGGETWQDPGRSWFDATTDDNAPTLQTWPGYAALPDTSPRGGELYNAGGNFTYGATRSYSRLMNIAFTWRRGQLVCLCVGQASHYNEQESTSEYGYYRIYALYCGGYSNLLRATNLHPVDDGDRGNLRYHWFPFETPVGSTTSSTPGPLPAAAFWGKYETGLNTGTLIHADPAVDNKPRFEIVTGDGAGTFGFHKYWANTDEALQVEVGQGAGASSTHNHIVEAEWALNVGTAEDSLPIAEGIAVHLTNGTLKSTATSPVRCRLNIGFDTTKIVLYDYHGAALISSQTLASLGLSYPLHLRARLGGGPTKYNVWACNYDPAESVKKWVIVGSGDLHDDSNGAEPRIEWGHIATGSTTTINKSEWYFFQCGSCEDHPDTGSPGLNSDGWTLTDNLADPDATAQYYAGGRRVSSVPVYVDDGVYIAGKDGPMVRGNEWRIKTRHDYGIENIHHEINASPDSTWRSTSDASQAEIVWKVGATSADGGYSLNRVYGLYLGNINFKTAYLDVQADGSTSWTQVAEIDAADGTTGLAFERKGNAIRPHTNSIAAGQYFNYGTLAGSHIAIDTGGSPAIRPIETNSEGVFSGATGKRTVIRIGGDLTGLSAGGSSVLCDIWSKEAAAIFHQMDTAHKIRLRIPAQTTYEGYFEIGSFVAGSVAVFGRQHSRGSMREIRTNTSIATQRSGTRRASVHGKSRRSAELSWADSVDISELQRDNPAPEYLSTMYGSLGSDPHHAHSTFNDGPTLIRGLLDRLDGAAVPVVYLPRIPATDFDGGVVTTKIANREKMLYGRIVSTKYRVENVLGSDQANEVVTGTTIRIDEEL